MRHEISLSDEELAELDELLRREVGDTRVELRRTRNRDFREHVHHHLEIVEGIRQSVERFTPAKSLNE